MPTIRPAAVAGTFYPAQAAVLRTQVQACLSHAHGTAEAPKLLIVPHAGFVYSGPIAGHAYARLAGHAAEISRVVLLGPAHRVALRGLAVPSVDAFQTPLGRVTIDVEARAALADLAQVVQDDRAHAQEHALEVQLPFLQTALGSTFKLLPLVVGDAGADEVAEVIERLWGGDETLIVISTDLSHYLPYPAAQATDRNTTARLLALATDFDPYEACGARALNGALLAARRHGLRPELLDLRNSGDTAGDRSRVVGYAALVLTAPLDDNAADAGEVRLGAALLARARNTIAEALGLAGKPEPEPEPEHPALARLGTTFVTLRDRQGALRGCIGGLVAVARLGDDVRRHAAAAAFEDPRFGPLQAHEWPGLGIEVSLLDTPQPLPPARTRTAALKQLRPGIDGVILECHGHRASFLPQVWAQLPELEAFFAALLRKAGLPSDFWDPDLRLQHYTVRHFELTIPVGAP